jgi:tRNA-specific 2-thiouridylase
MSHWKGGADLIESQVELRSKHACFGPDEAEDIAECRAFCADAGLEYYVVDLAEEYEKEVLDYFKAEFRRGHTPNPCVRCNGKVKFGALLTGLEKLGVTYDYFCTGHYASVIVPDEALPNGLRPPCIGIGADWGKDQSYFLYRVSGEVLQKVRFPLANMSKQDVKALAAKRGLSQAARQESQDFVPPGYLDTLFSDRPGVGGDFVDEDGRVLGHHRGIEHYTIGQRKGLGVSSDRPLYVQRIDAAANQIVLADENALAATSLVAGNWAWAGGVPPKGAFRGAVKIRSGSPAVAATIAPVEKPDGSWRVTFDDAVRAVAPGQSAVVYLDNLVFGGGIIEE